MATRMTLRPRGPVRISVEVQTTLYGAPVQISAMVRVEHDPVQRALGDAQLLVALMTRGAFSVDVTNIVSGTEAEEELIRAACDEYDRQRAEHRHARMEYEAELREG